MKWSIENSLNYPLGMLHLQDIDVSDPGTLQAVEVAVRDSTSLRRMNIWSYYRSDTLPWTNVASAILKGAAKNETLQMLSLLVPCEPLPPLQLIDEIRISHSKLQLIVCAGSESPLLAIVRALSSRACKVHLVIPYISLF